MKTDKKLVRLGKKLKVSDSSVDRNNEATIICKIPRINAIRNFLQIGESMSTEDIFDIDFNGLATKWKIIFYPKGQYDFGRPSKDCRLYVMLMSCEKDVVKMDIKARLIFSTPSRSTQDNTVPSFPIEHLFITNDKRSNWAGPLTMRTFEDDFTRSDCLMIKLTIRLIVDEINESKRSLRDVDSSLTDNLLSRSSKRIRSVSPAVKEDNQNVIEIMEVDENSSSPPTIKSESKMEVDLYQFESSPDPRIAKSKSSPGADFKSLRKTRNPFTTKSPLPSQRSTLPSIPFTTKSPATYQRLTQPSIESRAENSVNCQRGDYQHRRHSARTLIYTPVEREQIRNSGGSKSQNQLDKGSNRGMYSFKSSACLDVAGTVQSDTGEKSGTSDSNMVLNIR